MREHGIEHDQAVIHQAYTTRGRNQGPPDGEPPLKDSIWHQGSWMILGRLRGTANTTCNFLSRPSAWEKAKLPPSLSGVEIIPIGGRGEDFYPSRPASKRGVSAQALAMEAKDRQAEWENFRKKLKTELATS